MLYSSSNYAFGHRSRRVRPSANSLLLHVRLARRLDGTEHLAFLASVMSQLRVLRSAQNLKKI